MEGGPLPLVPAKAGTRLLTPLWIPACAGMSGKEVAARSLALDAGAADDPAPLVGLFGDHAGELRRPGIVDHEAALLQRGLDVRPRQHLADLGGNAVANLLRRTGGCEQPEGPLGFVAGDAG